MHAQIQEMELVRTKIYQLEASHVAMKQRWDSNTARSYHSTNETADTKRRLPA